MPKYALKWVKKQSAMSLIEFVIKILSLVKGNRYVVTAVLSFTVWIWQSYENVQTNSNTSNRDDELFYFKLKNLFK